MGSRLVCTVKNQNWLVFSLNRCLVEDSLFVYLVPVPWLSLLILAGCKALSLKVVFENYFTADSFSESIPYIFDSVRPLL